jgi:hypothetical protein
MELSIFSARTTQRLRAVNVTVPWKKRSGVADDFAGLVSMARSSKYRARRLERRAFPVMVPN